MSLSHPKKAIVLLSGGLDSATTLAMARESGYHIYALSFDYGQRHKTELQAAKRIADRMEVQEHKTATIDLRLFGGSSLTDTIEVPKHQHTAPSSQSNPTPVTYVPARNTIFLSFALAYAEVTQAWDIFIGANAVDYSGYPDCRSAYLTAYERMANLALAACVEGKGHLRIHSPLVHMRKAEIIQAGHRLGIDYSMTISCYNADSQGKACGQCDACYYRKKGFDDAGIPDPTHYCN